MTQTAGYNTWNSNCSEKQFKKENRNKKQLCFENTERNEAKACSFLNYKKENKNHVNLIFYRFYDIHFMCKKIIKKQDSVKATFD